MNGSLVEGRAHHDERSAHLRESSRLGMFAIRRIDHVAVCVPDVDAALARWRDLFGLEARDRGVSDALRTEAALLPLGESHIELVSPHGENPGLAKFLEKRGPGLHHVALEVEGLDAALALLRTLGVPLVDETPRTGARGHRVAFVHPSATGGVLVELVEPRSTPASPEEEAP
jgi:methylmalonyl-CoA/ethylmalonyl-CoA epimerase